MSKEQENLRQIFKNETADKLWAENINEDVGFSDKYVEWLEKQLLLYGVVGRSELFKCDCGSTNFQKNKMHDSIMCNDCKTVYSNI